MAGNEQRGSRCRGQSSRRGSRSLQALATPADGPGSAVAASTATPTPRQATALTPAPTARADWRLLQMQGMNPDEAASLMAFAHGMPASDLHWSLRQLSQLLFLRQMNETDHFGGDDGGSGLPQ